MAEQAPKYQFPWRAGNRFELLVDGTSFFARMLEAVERATRFVWIEIYLFESGEVTGHVIEALTRAVQRGVEVRLLADDYGALRLTAADRERLRAGGVQLALYNPLRYHKWLANLFRDHRKLLIVDGEVAFVTGAGITDDFARPDDPARSWRENAVRITGPVLQDWQQLFLRVWTQHAAPPAEAPAEAAAVAGAGMLGRVVSSSRLREQEIRRSFLNRVQGAATRVWFATAYFVPSRNVLRVLQRAAGRGADVRLLLPGPYTDHPAVRHAGRRFYGRLLRHGVRIYEYQPRFLHAKSVLCDDWVSIGSANLDRWNLRWNLEANQEVDDAGFAAQVQAMFEHDFADSLEIRYPEWHRRGLRERLREHVWGRVDMLLESLGRVRGVRMD
jgi:phosphatidylserine/phosphatidylglycerophosphate/cardiolipin synthase-like enzyme